MIRRNLFYKLLAVGVAIVLWVYVNAERNPQSQKTLTVPMQVRNLAKGYVADLTTLREMFVILSLAATAGLMIFMTTIKETVPASLKWSLAGKR